MTYCIREHEHSTHTHTTDTHVPPPTAPLQLIFVGGSYAFPEVRVHCAHAPPTVIITPTPPHKTAIALDCTILMIVR